MLQQIADMIASEFEVFEGDESVSETLRAAAWNVMDTFPNATASDFGDAAAMLGRHRQGAINRWNEAVKNMELALS